MRPRRALRASWIAAIGVVAIGSPRLPGFTFLGGTLGITTAGNGYQRDVRIFDNTLDASANDNQTPETSFPGALGAALSVWKAAKAWDSSDPLAGKNFDFDWQGTATSNLPNQNTVGFASCGPSPPLALTEPPIADGWRIIVCDEWIWSDGPGLPPFPQRDLQGVVAHELGHALGLDHAQTQFCTGPCAGQSTMCPTSCGGTDVDARDLAPDDADGLQALYGAVPANKPKITALSGSLLIGQTLVIHGQNFAPSVHVKFTAGTTQNVGAIPGVVFDVATTGTQISVTIPATASKGNVLVWEPALGLLSNAFPADVGGGPPVRPTISGVSPPQVAVFAPGTITVSGSAFTNATQLLSDGSPVAFTVVNDGTITYVASQPSTLGPVAVTVSTSFGTSNDGTFTYVETSPPALAANSFAFTGQPFTWSFGGPPIQFWFLIVAGDPTTVPFGGFDFLLNAQILSVGALDPAGLGSLSATIPPGLAGKKFHSQIVTFDGAFDVRGTNVTQTTIFF